ncbi:hypothetical protein ACLB2K_058377 [Fragaria x ananassa]
MSKCSEAAEAVANIEELLTQILESVPLQSLTRFKCVSKHWQSLISNLRTLKYPKISSFISSKTEAGSFKSIPIDHREIPSGWNPFKIFNDLIHRRLLVEDYPVLQWPLSMLPQHSKKRKGFDSEESFRVVAATPPVPMVVKNIPLKECRNRPQDSHCVAENEMGRDYSGWFVKYHVDLNPTALPQRNLDPFVILCLSREREEEFRDPSSIMLLHMPGKVTSYNLRDKNFKTSSVLAIEDTKMYKVGYYPYMETLACV